MFAENHISQFQSTLEILQKIKSLKTFFCTRNFGQEKIPGLRETRNVYSDKQ